MSQLLIDVSLELSDISSGFALFGPRKPLIVRKQVEIVTTPGPSRLKPSLRRFEAIEASKACPLFKCIIAPTHDKFYVGKSVGMAKFSDKISSKFDLRAGFFGIFPSTPTRIISGTLIFLAKILRV